MWFKYKLEVPYDWLMGGSVILEQLTLDDREQFILDNHEAFNNGEKMYPKVKNWETVTPYFE